MRRRDPDLFSIRQWPDWSFLAERRESRKTVLVVNGAALLVLILRAIGIVNRGYEPVRGGIALCAIALYAVGFLVALWFGPSVSRRARIALVCTVFVFGSVPALLLASPDYLTDMTYAIAIGLMLLPLRFSLSLGVAVVIGQLGWMWLGEGQVSWGQVAILVGVTAGLGIVFALTFTIGQLRAAREQIARMAVNQERERVARDLHDILGHSLTTMTVKLGLTRRILESTGDVDRAVGEIRGLESLSRQALSDVRATVSDYRTVSLAAEIAGARVALSAAGVRAELPTATDDVASELQAVFGYVVREAVTNVLRHSDTQRCRIRIGRDWVEIADDGTVPTGAAAGHGLTGLAERLAAVSGTLEHGNAAGGGYRLVARGPAAGTA